jgi:hypothetical protein
MTVQTLVKVSVVSKKVIEVSRQRVTRFATTADSSKAFPEHSITIRRAPAGKFKGEVHLEIACPQHLFATDALRAFDITISEVERVTFGFGAKWKLFRFDCSATDAAKLLDNCTISDKSADETAYWLANFDAVGTNPGRDWNEVVA